MKISQKFMCVLLISIFSFTSCNIVNEISEVKQTNTQIKTQNITNYNTLRPSSDLNPNKINYISLDNCFVGSYENGKWNSCQNERNKIAYNYRAFTVDEVKKTGPYKAYSSTKKISDISKIYDEKEPSNGDLEHFRFLYPQDAKLLMTGDWNPASDTLTTRKSANVEEKKVIKDILDSKGLTKSSIKIDSITSVDIDKDGKNEEFIVANLYHKLDGEENIKDPFKDFKHEENVINIPKDMGVYSILVMKKNGKVIPIYTEVVDYTAKEYISLFITVELLGIFDLNGDGNMEICLKNIQWDRPGIRVYELINNSVNCVLYGNFIW